MSWTRLSVGLALAPLCIAVGMAHTGAAQEGVRGMEAATREVNWRAVRGVNYLPSYAANPRQMWRDFDADTVLRELGWARSIGFDSVRVFLSYGAFRESEGRFERNLRRFLELCGHSELTAALVLFDCCGIEERPSARPTTVGEFYRRFVEDPATPEAVRTAVRMRYGAMAGGRGRDIAIRAASDTPVDILFWQDWIPEPGLGGMAPDRFRPLERYVDRIIQVAGASPQFILCDLLNEPGTHFDLPAGMDRSAAEARTAAFARRLAALLAEKYPRVARTIGAESFQRMAELADAATVLSLHSFQPARELEELLRRGAVFAVRQRKPFLITECLANTNHWLDVHGEEALATDEGQLARYRETLPVLTRERVGWYSWGFVAGRSYLPFTAILYPSGYRRPAAMFLQEQLRPAR